MTDRHVRGDSVWCTIWWNGEDYIVEGDDLTVEQAMAKIRQRLPHVSARVYGLFTTAGQELKAGHLIRHRQFLILRPRVVR